METNFTGTSVGGSVMIA